MNEQTEVDKIHNGETNGKNREATLVWRNVNVFVKDKKQRGKNSLKQIINNSTGCIKPGTLMAMMGSRFDKQMNMKIFRPNYTFCSDQFQWCW